MITILKHKIYILFNKKYYLTIYWLYKKVTLVTTVYNKKMSSNLNK